VSRARDQSISIRMTDEERKMITQAYRWAGFEWLSDWARPILLAEAEKVKEPVMLDGPGVNPVLSEHGPAADSVIEDETFDPRVDTGLPLLTTHRWRDDEEMPRYEPSAAEALDPECPRVHVHWELRYGERCPTCGGTP
jgi:hypothetical protein